MKILLDNIIKPSILITTVNNEQGDRIGNDLLIIIYY